MSLVFLNGFVFQKEICMNNKIANLVQILIPLFLVIILCILGAKTIGLPVVAIVGGSGFIAWFAWLRFNFPTSADPNIIVVPFLLTCGALMLHIVEEYIMDFPAAMSQLFNIHFSLTAFVLTFALAAVVISDSVLRSPVPLAYHK